MREITSAYEEITDRQGWWRASLQIEEHNACRWPRMNRWLGIEPRQAGEVDGDIGPGTYSVERRKRRKFSTIGICGACRKPTR